MRRLGRIARWWWRWLLICSISLGLGGLVLLSLAWAGWLPLPSVVQMMPPAASQHVSPRSPLVLHFSTAMDQSSVEAALRIEPAARGTWTWSNRATAIWTPAPMWTPATSYTIHLSSAARSMLRQPLAQPFSFTFSTAPAPALVFRSPTPNEVIPARAPLVLRVDRPLISPAELETRGLPELRLTPPVSTTAHWIDPQTVVVEGALQPSTTYTATLGPLVDVLGTPLELAPWQFTTQSPQLLSSAPALDERIAPTQPLSLTFAGILDPVAVEHITRAIVLQPPVTATWSVAINAAPIPQTTLLLLPARGWSAAAYTATFALGTTSQQWRWAIEAPLRVIGTLPGRGGEISPDDELRLVFNTPPTVPDLAKHLIIEPPVPEFKTNIVGAQLRVSGAFTPTTAYTLTLTSQQGPSFQLPFRTSGTASSLHVAAPTTPFSVWRPEQTPQVSIAWSGAARATARLYALDRALLTNVLINPSAPFEANRYNLIPLQTWSLAESSSSQTTLALTATEALPGGYILQVAVAGGPSTQHVLVVSAYALSLNATTTTADVWAIDLRSGQPAIGLPMVIVRGGSQLGAGTTDDTGQWQTPIPAGTGPLLALGGSADSPAVGTLALPMMEAAEPTATAMLDRSVYFNGDELRVSGVIHWPSTPPLSPTLELALIAADGQTHVAAQSQRLNTASFNASIPLRTNYAPGTYDLRIAAAGYTLAVLPLTIARPVASNLSLDIPARVVAGTTLRGEIILREAYGLASAGRRGSWTVQTPDGGVLSRSDFRADAAGVAAIELPLPRDLNTAVLIVSAESAGQWSSASTQIVPSRTLTLSVDRTLAQPGDRVQVTATISTGMGQPVANAPVEISVMGDAAPELFRRTTNTAGQVQFSWRPSGSGRFTLEARSDAASSQMVSVWSARRGFTGWPSPRDEQLDLAVERVSLPTGATIHVLPLLPVPGGRAHLVWQSGATLASKTVDWQAGVPLSLTLPLSTTGRVPLHIMLLTTERGLPTIRAGRVTIELADPAAIQVEVIGTNPLQIRTRTSDGAPVATRLQLAIRESSRVVATGRGANILAPGARADLVAWLPNAQTDATGTWTLPITLPPNPHDWQLDILASTALGSGSTQGLLPAQPVPSINLALPTDLQVGDSTTATLRLGATTNPFSTTLVITTSNGIALDRQMYQVTPAASQPTLLAIPLRANTSGSQQFIISSTTGTITRSFSQTVVVHPSRPTHSLRTSAVITTTTDLTWTLPLSATAGTLLLATAPTLADLQAAGTLALAHDTSIIAAAGRIALAQTSNLTTTFAADLAILREAQHRDGGWSWGAGPSDPILTALMVRILATARPQPALEPLLVRSTTWLTAQYASSNDIDTQASILAALARRKQPVAQAIIGMLDSVPLRPTSELLLTTALYDLGSAREAATYAQRLLQQPLWNTPHTAPWESPARTAALLGQLGLLAQPHSPSIATAVLQLGQTWTGSGWDDPAATIEALMFLRTMPSSPQNPYRIVENGTTLYAGTAAFSTSLPLNTRPVRVTVEADGAVPLATRQTWSAGFAPAAGIVLLTTRDEHGMVIAPNTPLAVGAPTTWEMTLVVLKPLPYAEITVTLPAPVAVDAVDGGQLSLEADKLVAREPLLPAGVYPITIQGRPLLPGTFAIPLPIITTTGKAIDLGGTLPPLVIRAGP